MRQKGNNFVEYASMLGWWSGSDGVFWGLTETGSLGSFGSAAELLQAGSKSTEQTVYDRHMKWLKEKLPSSRETRDGQWVHLV